MYVCIYVSMYEEGEGDAQIDLSWGRRGGGEGEWLMLASWRCAC